MAPTPQPLGLTCPTRIDATATNSGPVGVTFNPESHGGTPPINIECSPAAGDFAVGETPVTCHATDAANQTASCEFIVAVVIPPKLAVTKFDAFGDSITEGVTSLTDSLVDSIPMPEAYPGKLESMLAQRYAAQTFTVFNRGIGGEELAQGRKRLPGVLDADHPEVLLLLEGINNIRGVTTDALADDLDRMVTTARRRGVKVILAKLLPISSGREARMPGTMGRIEAFNGEIVRIAGKYHMDPVVDTFAAFSANPSLIGADGLHPTAEGQTRLAELFFDAIKARYEEAPEAIAPLQRMITSGGMPSVFTPPSAPNDLARRAPNATAAGSVPRFGTRVPPGRPGASKQ